MSVAAILEEAKRRGIVLEIDGLDIRYRAPKGRLTPELVEAMRRHKAELLQALQVPARVRGQDAVVPSAQAETCWHCHGEKTCQCAVYAVPAPRMRWDKGECRACLGSGYLCWPGRVQ